MYEVEPGDKQGPFHTHHANEEWVIVLRGVPTLRTHEGERQLRAGDVEYLDTGKVSARSVAGERIMFGRPGPVLDYWEGEE